MLVTFKLKNCIYDVLQHFRSCNASFLINMPDQQHRCMRFFRKTKNRRRTLSDLCDASGRRFDTLGRNSLYGVDDHQIGIRILDMYINLLEGSLANNETVTGNRRETVGTEL